MLDTHIVLWVVSEDKPVPRRYINVLQARDTEVFISSVSEWEIAIKRSTGKLNVPPTFFQILDTARYTPLNVTHVHARAVERLPNLHKDPFDRLLIAQAQCEGMTLATVDSQVLKYDVQLL